MNLGTEMTVEESINLQVLHWATPQGKVPLSGDDSWCRLLLCYGFIKGLDLTFNEAIDVARMYEATFNAVTSIRWWKS